MAAKRKAAKTGNNHSAHSARPRAVLAPSEDEIATDEALALFFRRPPTAADHVVVTTTTPAGDQIVQDRTAAEASRAPIGFANTVTAACEKYARAEGRELRFRAIWMAGDRVLASHQWRAGEGDPTALDGTVDSFMAQQQRHMEDLHRLYIDGFQLQQSTQAETMTALRAELADLRKDNESLRDRLRKAGDVDAEIAIQTTAAELESRSRQADLLEHKLIPLIEHIVVKKLEAPSAPAALAEGNNNKSPDPDRSGQADRTAS